MPLSTGVGRPRPPLLARDRVPHRHQTVGRRELEPRPFDGLAGRDHWVLQRVFEKVEAREQVRPLHALLPPD